MRLFGLDIIRARPATASPLSPVSRAGHGWVPLVREPYTGAWQQNDAITTDTALSNAAAYACVTLIAQDVGKLPIRLVEQDAEGIWQETTNPAYSPVLRKPNRYQTVNKFFEQWMTSKLVHGNTYVLKERDQRGVVKALYVLDPSRVTPLVAPDGAVYYELRRDDLAGAASAGTVTLPASEIMHDQMVCLFHPLIGVSPLYACGLSALQGNNIQRNSNAFFANGSRPSGILTAPGAITQPDATKLQQDWQAGHSGDKQGEVAVLSGGLTYHPLSVTAEDAQLIEQLKWSAETICSCYHVPAYKVGVGPHPPYNNVEPLNQQYYSDCIQALLASCEAVLDEGLGLLGTDLGTEFETDDLIWLDTMTKTKAAAEAIGSGTLAPNEARRKYFGVGSVPGGETPYLQQQQFSLSALAERDADAPFSKPAPAAPALPPADDAAENEQKFLRMIADEQKFFLAFPKFVEDLRHAA